MNGDTALGADDGHLHAHLRGLMRGVVQRCLASVAARSARPSESPACLEANEGRCVDARRPRNRVDSAGSMADNVPVSGPSCFGHSRPTWVTVSGFAQFVGRHAHSAYSIGRHSFMRVPLPFA